MARETKAEREERERKEKIAADRQAKRAEKIAAEKQAAEKTPAIIVVDFSDDTKNLLRALIEVLGTRPAPIIQLDQKADPVQTALPQGLGKTAATAKHLKAEAPELFEDDAPVTLTQIRELINTQVAAGKTEAIVSLLGKHGTKNAQGLDASAYSAFYKSLEAL